MFRKHIKQMFLNRPRLHKLSIFSRGQSNSYDNFTSSDKESILDHMNNASQETLFTWSSLSQSQAAAIIEHREARSRFTALPDILHVKGLGKTTLRKFTCEYLGRRESELWPESESKPKYKVRRNVVHPSYLSSEIPQAVVSCGIQLDSIYWARLNDNLVLTDWNYQTLGEYMRRRYDHVAYQHKLWQVLKAFPVGDLYLLEDTPVLTSNLSAVPGAMNRARLDATWTTLLNQRHNNDPNTPFLHKVHKVKDQEVGRHFDLVVGGETVSSQKVVRDILRNNGKVTDLSVSVSSKQIQNFNDSKKAVKEQMCRIFLQGIMFYDILFKQHRSEEDNTHDAV